MERHGTGKIMNQELESRNMCENGSILGHCTFVHVYTVPENHLHKQKLSTAKTRKKLFVNMQRIFREAVIGNFLKSCFSPIFMN